MAESPGYLVAESLIAKISSSHIYQASTDIGVYDDLQAFKESLLSIRDWLWNVEFQKKHINSTQLFLREIKQVLHDAENVVDEFECERLRNEVVNAHVNSITKVARFFSTSNPFVFGLRMAKQIKELDKRLCTYKLLAHWFGLQMTGTADTQEDKRKRRFTSTDYSFPNVVIGREEDKEKIIKLLIHQNPCGDDLQSLTVIPIVGMEGLGKTTLAHSVFIDKRIDQSFSSKIWVSARLNIKQVIVQIIRYVTDTLAKTEEQRIIQLRNILEKQKFLLVLDNVWFEDPLKWGEFRNLISSGREGSKILVTTRSHSIASMMGTIPSHNLKGLSMEDSLFLFEKFAFKEGEEKMFPNL